MMEMKDQTMNHLKLTQNTGAIKAYFLSPKGSFLNVELSQNTNINDKDLKVTLQEFEIPESQEVSINNLL